MENQDNRKPESRTQGPATPSGDQRISLSLDDLKQLMAQAVASAVSQSSESGAKVLAEAILESRKPYVSPQQLANEESMKKSMKALQERMDADIKQSQKNCSHLQGSNALSDYPSPHMLSSIIKHQLDTGELVGICTNCTRIIRWDDPEYDQLMNKMKSGNKASQAGQRMFRDPIAAWKAGR